MLSFRQKIFLAYLVGFVLFLLLLFPLSNRLVHQIITGAMESRSLELIRRIEFANNDEGLIKTLKDQKPLLFFRVSVITNDRRVLYDSHTKRLLGPRFSQEYVVDHPEVLEAFRKGKGYHEDYSELLGQKFAYMALSFDFHGKTYILRTAFPYQYLSELQKELELGFLTLAILILIAFSLLSWLIINHFTKPIQSLIRQVRPYKEGKTDALPMIDFPGIHKNEDFALLAHTLNDLNRQIQRQIDQAKEASREKEVLLESLVEGVVAVDSQEKIYFANQSALNFFGLPKERLIGRTFEEAGFEKCAELIDHCQMQRVMLQDSLELTSKNKTFHFNMVAAPKNDGTGALLVLQDMTQEIRMLEMRKDFIANASHELKTPITIIQGFAETLHDNPDLPETVRIDSLGKIVKNCQRMHSLILDLLTLSDIENLPASRQMNFDLSQLLKKCRLNLLEMYKGAQVELTCEEPLFLTADPDLMELAIMNLLTNGAKYSVGSPELTVRAYRKEGKLHIDFSDKGIGIPEEELPKIFDRFYRVDKAHSRKVGGTGLGLSLVQTIITKHHGTIAVHSVKGEGSTFSLTI